MKRSFWSLVVVQIQVLLNDNGAKLMLMTLGVAVAPEEGRSEHRREPVRAPSVHWQPPAL